MYTFGEGDRLKVLKDVEGIPVNVTGTVTRVTVGGGRLWVELDQRSRNEKVHPFGKDDPRARQVQAFMGDCEPPTENRKGRRKKEHEARPETVPIDRFGKDHWSTFAYLETRIVDYQGVPKFEHLRCIDKRWPLYGHGHDASNYPTRLRGGDLLRGHDDWDCIHDLIAAELLLDVGSSANPRFALTAKGIAVASRLREHKAKGGSFATFEA